MAPGLVLGLEKYEKMLLGDFCSAVMPNSALIDVNQWHSEQIEHVFSQWRWVREVEGELRYIINSKDMFHFHEGDREKIFKLFLTRLPSRRGFGDSLYSKVAGLVEENAKFTEEFAKMSEGVPSVVPKVTDIQFWDLLSSMYLSRLFDFSLCSDLHTLSQKILEINQSLKLDRDNLSAKLSELQTSGEVLNQHFTSSVTDQEPSNQKGSAKHKPVMGDIIQDKRFDVWSLIRRCSVFERASCHRDKVWEALTHCGFHDHYQPTKTGFCPKGENKGVFSFEHPTHFIEYIPWDELKAWNGPHSQKESHKNLQFAHWLPRKAMKFEHHLHPNEAVYRYCVETGTYLPGYVNQEGHVFFVLSPLENSGFVEELHYYWTVYNDCAITQAPAGDWLLLETLPGVEFRRVRDTEDDFSAILHFCRIIDKIRFGNYETLKKSIGLSIDADYEELLDLIPFEQITSVERDPIGQGARGVVFRGIWSCPQKTDMPFPEDIAVALKAMKPSFDGEKRFIKELYAILATTKFRKWSPKCIPLLGITRTPSNSVGSDASTDSSSTFQPSPAQILPPDTLVLVSEFAELGSVRTYLERTLKGNVSDWTLINNFLRDLTNYVMELHERGVIHRDLHENNVLIVINKTPMDPESLEGPKLMISDLGESTLSDESFCGGTYGYQNVWAPEVRRGRHYSAASDVYAMGCLIAKIVKLQWDVAERKDRTNIAKAPKVVVEIMKRCLVPDPENRISADEAYGMMESSWFDDEDGVLVDVDPIDLFSFDVEHPGGDEEIPL